MTPTCVGKVLLTPCYVFRMTPTCVGKVRNGFRIRGGYKNTDAGGGRLYLAKIGAIQDDPHVCGEGTS